MVRGFLFRGKPGPTTALPNYWVPFLGGRSVPMTLSDLERRNARSQNFQRDLLHYARTVWRRTTKFGSITLLEKGVFPGSATFPPQGGGLQRSPILEVPFHLCVHVPLTQKYDQIWRGITYRGGGLLLRVSHDPSRRAEPQRSPTFGIFLYTL